MRLLDARTLEFKEFFGKPTPRYAILSHTWGNDEVSYQDMIGYHKRKQIRNCAQVACGKGINYVWIDTCCIDKSSSSELQEAINSMFCWYTNASLCCTYLADVEQSIRCSETAAAENPGFRCSRWFKRGWTLQELLAPSMDIFFNRTWGEIGTRDTLSEVISDITAIERRYLKGYVAIHAPISQRMLWLSGCETTRKDDIAYCALGIFDINMPLLYGEGKRAFFRLQQEILRGSNDASIFTWGFTGTGPP
ncbi:heterokaryon incompatibility protein-domain-containing protein [Truncatella angustata]|uniref:Heterokaryon incompatibility protein-domain-containing protein n=1 Tax=Truncatella angustata TaxID=152316 RepID=A0A9P8RPE0_9PEZI|nr:heterokaryon incompatibility protein-domain-containing protein [Truncatella angustata]KAH6647910.1 heterokaryon incompatibility protein-domain-containing protein [Truncatella angustata]